MTEIEFIDHPELKEILKGYVLLNRERQVMGYNLFTISSYTSHLENFHSDIIHSLLNPLGLHNEKYSFLFLFLNYLRKDYNVNVDYRNYNNVSVLKEVGRIDIWIRDESTKHSIIIENKINDATDRNDQLLDYFEFAKANNYTVDTIVYLSKDGKKLAPKQSKTIASPILNIGAFSNTNSDLLNGWLLPCKSNASTDDSKSFLIQYCKLIKHLSNNSMDNDIKEQFYKLLSKNNSIQTIESLRGLLKDYPNYRGEKFGKRTVDYKPFKSRTAKYRNYWMFKEYEYGNGNYNLDVIFEDSGNAKVVFYNTVNGENEGIETTRKILSQLGLNERFNIISQFPGLTADFNLSELHMSLEEVDYAILDFVLLIFSGLKKLAN